MQGVCRPACRRRTVIAVAAASGPSPTPATMLQGTTYQGHGGQVPGNPAYWGNVLGLAGYVVLVGALVGGALLSGRLGTRWAGGRGLFVSHQWLSWALIILALGHALLLWPRRGPGVGLAWWWPVAVEGVPLAVAMGPFAVYALVVVTVSYYARRRLGYPAWRWL